MGSLRHMPSPPSFVNKTEQYVANFGLVKSKTEFIVCCFDCACGALNIDLTLYSFPDIKLALG